MNAASAGIIAPVSANASSKAQPHGVDVVVSSVDNSGVYVCYLKGLVSVYFRCPARSTGRLITYSVFYIN